MTSVPTVDVQTANARPGDIVLLDVREPEEWATGHAPNAVHHPLGTIDSYESPATVYVVCKAGGRSATAVENLRARGIDAHNVAGGMLAWQEAGYAVTTDSGEAGDII